MKTVAKKTVKKVPLKVTAKVAAKKAVKPAKAIAKTVAKNVAKPVKKPATKSATKPTAKPAAKRIAKPVSKPVVKATVKSTAKPAAKAVVKKTIKPIAKSAAKTKPAKPTKPVKSVKVAEVVAKKAVKPAKTIEKSKAVSKPPKVESHLKQPMVIASKIAPPETKDLSPATPAPSKARTSRLASLTVPSMAQSVASTAAKSSYGPHVPSLALIPPPQYTPKHNPKLANNWKTKTAQEMTDAELLAMPDSEYMNIKQMTYFRLKLIELKQGILANAGATSEHLRDESAVVPDPTDRATIEEEHALELRTRDRERKLLKKIEQSIARIDAGDYGYCDETGEAIGVGRLLARPTATLSLEAQQRRELKQKMYGD
jgi:DnaK suppressor protein